VTKNAKRIWIRIIAAFEIVGGIVGTLFMIYAAVAAGFAFKVMVIIPIALAIFILSLIAGIYLWKGAEFGRKASIVIQFIQLPKLMSPLLIFTFSFGADVFSHVTFFGEAYAVGLQFRFLSDSQLFVNTDPGFVLFGFSLPAVVALVTLWNYRPAIPEDLTGELNPPEPNEYFTNTSGRE
jgi:hypothetical protein